MDGRGGQGNLRPLYPHPPVTVTTPFDTVTIIVTYTIYKSVCHDFCHDFVTMTNAVLSRLSLCHNLLFSFYYRDTR